MVENAAPFRRRLRLQRPVTVREVAVDGGAYRADGGAGRLDPLFLDRVDAAFRLLLRGTGQLARIGHVRDFGTLPSVSMIFACRRRDT